jgi:hypothetical protein
MGIKGLAPIILILTFGAGFLSKRSTIFTSYTEENSVGKLTKSVKSLFGFKLYAFRIIPWRFLY